MIQQSDRAECDLPEISTEIKRLITSQSVFSEVFKPRFLVESHCSLPYLVIFTVCC